MLLMTIFVVYRFGRSLGVDAVIAARVKEPGTLARAVLVEAT
jgi:hypothetical protein